MTCDLFIPRADLCNRCNGTRDAHPAADPGLNATWRQRAETAEADVAEQRARAEEAESLARLIADDRDDAVRALATERQRAEEAEAVAAAFREAIGRLHGDIVTAGAGGLVHSQVTMLCVRIAALLDADAANDAGAALLAERDTFRAAAESLARVHALTAALGGPDRAAMEIDVAEGRREWDGRLAGSLKSTGGGPAIVDGRFLAPPPPAAPDKAATCICPVEIDGWRREADKAATVEPEPLDDDALQRCKTCGRYYDDHGYQGECPGPAKGDGPAPPSHGRDGAGGGE